MTGTQISEAVAVLHHMSQHFARSQHPAAPMAFLRCSQAQGYLAAVALELSQATSLQDAVEAALESSRLGG